MHAEGAACLHVRFICAANFGVLVLFLGHFAIGRNACLFGKQLWPPKTTLTSDKHNNAKSLSSKLSLNNEKHMLVWTILSFVTF
jgi:uncharacterized membrane protein